MALSCFFIVFLFQYSRRQLSSRKREVQNLAKTEGILVGISTGASLAAVRKQLQTLNGNETILTMNYDTGERYLSIDELFTKY